MCDFGGNRRDGGAAIFRARCLRLKPIADSESARLFTSSGKFSARLEGTFERNPQKTSKTRDPKWREMAVLRQFFVGKFF